MQFSRSKRLPVDSYSCWDRSVPNFISKRHSFWLQNVRSEKRTWSRRRQFYGLDFRNILLQPVPFAWSTPKRFRSSFWAHFCTQYHRRWSRRHWKWSSSLPPPPSGTVCLSIECGCQYQGISFYRCIIRVCRICSVAVSSNFLSAPDCDGFS